MNPGAREWAPTSGGASTSNIQMPKPRGVISLGGPPPVNPATAPPSMPSASHAPPAAASANPVMPKPKKGGINLSAVAAPVAAPVVAEEAASLPSASSPPPAEAKPEPKAAPKVVAAPVAAKAAEPASTTPPPPSAEATAASAAAAAAELAAAADEDPRDHLNIVCIGHVDAGKSTLCGAILLAMGIVDKRTIEKYEREAKERNRESWYLAYIMDTNEEERARGKTVEIGRAWFETPNKRFTLLDAPGHKNYIPAMLSGAAHADVGVLVISSRTGEFESGFEKQGQTREHAMLAYTLGIRKLVVVVNKLDDSGWSKERYDEIVGKLTPFLKECGYKVKKEVIFMPIAALKGSGILKRVDPVAECPWVGNENGGRALIETLESIVIEDRDPKGPLRMSILDVYQDQGAWAIGKIESGNLVLGMPLIASPMKFGIKVEKILINEIPVRSAKAGENVCVKFSGSVNDGDVKKGFVFSDERIGGTLITATCKVLELLEHRRVVSAGYTFVLHGHTITEEATIKEILCKHIPETGAKVRQVFAKSGDLVTVRIFVKQSIAVETFAKRPQLGRITLRDEGKSIAIGKITKVEDFDASKSAEQ